MSRSALATACTEDGVGSKEWTSKVIGTKRVTVILSPARLRVCSYTGKKVVRAVTPVRGAGRYVTATKVPAETRAMRRTRIARFRTRRARQSMADATDSLLIRIVNRLLSFWLFLIRCY